MRKILKFTKILFISRVTFGISLSVAESSRTAGLVGQCGKILKRRRIVERDQECSAIAESTPDYLYSASRPICRKYPDGYPCSVWSDLREAPDYPCSV